MASGRTRFECDLKIKRMNLHCEVEDCPAYELPEIAVFDLVLEKWSSYCEAYDKERGEGEISIGGPEMQDIVLYWKYLWGPMRSVMPMPMPIFW